MANQYNQAKTATSGITHFIIRLIVGSIVLGITAVLTPGFKISGLWPLIVGAVVLATLDYVALKFLGIDATPLGRGLTGFIMAAVIIYLTQFLVSGFSVTILGALLGALIYGIIDAVIPGRAM